MSSAAAEAAAVARGPGAPEPAGSPDTSSPDVPGAGPVGPGLRPAEELAARIRRAASIKGDPVGRLGNPADAGPEDGTARARAVPVHRPSIPRPGAAGGQGAPAQGGAVRTARASQAEGQMVRQAHAGAAGTGPRVALGAADGPGPSGGRAEGAGPDSLPRGALAGGAILVERMASTSLEVRAALRRLCARAPGLGLSAEACMALEIVLAEALNNIVEHSYREHPSGWIVAEVECVGGWVVCRLTDGGGAMPGGTPPAACPDPGARAAELPDGGFGWQMIRDLADDVTYTREGGVNRLLFALPMGAATRPAPMEDR